MQGDGSRTRATDGNVSKSEWITICFWNIYSKWTAFRSLSLSQCTVIHQRDQVGRRKERSGQTIWVWIASRERHTYKDSDRMEDGEGNQTWELRLNFDWDAKVSEWSKEQCRSRCIRVFSRSETQKSWNGRIPRFCIQYSSSNDLSKIRQVEQSERKERVELDKTRTSQEKQEGRDTHLQYNRKYPSDWPSVRRNGRFNRYNCGLRSITGDCAFQRLVSFEKTVCTARNHGDC